MPSNLIKGFTAHARAARLILRDAEVRRLAARPLLVNILLMVVGLPIGIYGAIELSGMLVGGSGVMATLLRTFVQILAAAVGVFLTFFVLLLVGSAIAGPLNSKLSLAVEQKIRGTGFRAGDTSVMQDVARSLAFSLGRLAIALLCYPPIFLTQFIPGLGVILFPVLSLLYGATVLSLDFSDYVFERHYTTVRQKIGHVWGRKSLYFGFGGGLALLLLIPLAGFVILPVGVVGATMLYVEETS